MRLGLRLAGQKLKVVATLAACSFPPVRRYSVPIRGWVRRRTECCIAVFLAADAAAACSEPGPALAPAPAPWLFRPPNVACLEAPFARDHPRSPAPLAPPGPDPRVRFRLLLVHCDTWAPSQPLCCSAALPQISRVCCDSPKNRLLCGSAPSRPWPPRSKSLLLCLDPRRFPCAARLLPPPIMLCRTG